MTGWTQPLAGCRTLSKRQLRTGDPGQRRHHVMEIENSWELVKWGEVWVKWAILLKQSATERVTVTLEE